MNSSAEPNPRWPSAALGTGLVPMRMARAPSPCPLLEVLLGGSAEWSSGGPVRPPGRVIIVGPGPRSAGRRSQTPSCQHPARAPRPRARSVRGGRSDCCQHPSKAHKSKLSIGVPVGKIDSVHPTVAGISSDRGAYHVPVMGSTAGRGFIARRGQRGRRPAAG